MQLERTRDEEGRYFGHFEDKDEAQQFLETQINRYRYTPNPEKTSINRLCKEALSQGIKLYPASFSNELERRGIEVRGYRPQKSKKYRSTYTVSYMVREELEAYPNKSYIVDLGIRVVLGIPTEDIVIFFPSDKEQCNVIFEHTKKGNIEATISGELDRKFEQQIRMLLKRARNKGNEAIIQYAETNGYQYVGGTQISSRERS